MPFQSSNPVVIEGKTYPYFGVSLVTSPGFGDKFVDARVVLNLDPYRLDEAGNVERPMVTITLPDSLEGATMSIVDQSKTVTKVFTNAYTQAASDPVLARALMKISEALQEFIVAKGL